MARREQLTVTELFLKDSPVIKGLESGREAFTNSGTASADVEVTVTFETSFSAAPKVVLGSEAALTTYISTAATATGFKMTVKSVPAGETVYVNWMAIGQ